MGITVPPNSALPKSDTDLLNISNMTARIAVTVYKVTLNPREPDSTLNPPSVP